MVRGPLCAFAVVVRDDCFRVRGRGRRRRVERQEERTERRARRRRTSSGRTPTRSTPRRCKAQKTGATAQAAKQQKSCNKAGERGYEQWRSCWHKLLDPFRKALAGLATELGTLAEREFPEDCVTSLEAGEAAFTAFAAQVDGLLRGIDSKRRAAQVRALRIYDTTLGEISKSFAEPFQAVTQVCYSPKDLASINASPRPSPRTEPEREP